MIPFRIWHHIQKLRNWIEARGWLHFGEYLTLGWSYNLLSRFCHMHLTAGGGGDDDISFSIAVPPVAIWLHAEFDWKSRFCFRRILDKEMEIELSVHHWGLWWSLWHTAHEWVKGTPKWRNGCWYPLDTLFGKVEYFDNKNEQKRHEVEIPLFERKYKGKAVIYKCWWRRKYIPWKLHEKVYCEIEIPGGIPVGGKGENSWDCGPDKIFAFTTQGRDIGEGIAKLIGDVIETRNRYGEGLENIYQTAWGEFDEAHSGQ